MAYRLAYFVTHPIQYQAPLLRLIAASGQIDLQVFFLSDFSLRAHHEKLYNRTFKWDTPLTEGYSWQVLPRWGVGHSTAKRSWLPVRGIKKLLYDGQFNAVWVHGWSHVGLFQAVRAASVLGLPILMRGDSVPDAAPRRDLRARLRNAYYERLFPQIACFLCVGTRNREFYLQYGVPGKRMVTMPYAVDNDFFRTRAQDAAKNREVFRRELGLEPGRAVILFAATFAAVKAPMDLISAYQTAWGADEAGKPYLLFVGDGPLREEMKVKAGTANETDVRFLGFKNQSELPALYDLCDVFVLPSISDRWGLVVNEVMNAAKPVIVSDRVGAAPDLVSEGVNGCVYPHRDVSALAFKLKTILELPQAERECMGRKSLERIGEFSFEADHNALLEALRLVCKRCEATDDILT